MIILEGCDATGKTTLAEKLSKRYSSSITHYTKHDGEVMLKHAELGSPGTGEIVDRFQISEIPYSMYYRHEIPLYEEVADIGKMLRGGVHLMIICSPPWEIVKAEWEKRRDMEVIKNVQQLHQIYMWYRDKAQAFLPFPMWYYDYVKTPTDDLILSIEEWIDEQY